MLKTVLHFAFGCILLAYIVLGYVAYLLFWPIPTLVLTAYSDANPVQILNEEIHPGDTLKYNLSYCKYTDLSAIVHRTLLDGQVITLTDTPGKLPRGCRTQQVQTAVVPDTINPGRYYLDVSVEYKLNPLRTEFIHYHTTYFDVVPK